MFRRFLRAVIFLEALAAILIFLAIKFPHYDSPFPKTEPITECSARDQQSIRHWRSVLAFNADGKNYDPIEINKIQNEAHNGTLDVNVVRYCIFEGKTIRY